MKEKFICTTEDFIPWSKFTKLGEVQTSLKYVAPEDSAKYSSQFPIKFHSSYEYIIFGNRKAECYAFDYAMSNLIENALQIGADAIINIKYTLNYYPKKTGEERIKIYGTAVKTINQ